MIGRVWLHNIKKLSDLKREVDQLVAIHGDDAVTDIESCGYGRICVDVYPSMPKPARKAPFEIGDRVQLREHMVPRYPDAGVVTHMEWHAGHEMFHYRFANDKGESRAEPECYLEAAT